MDRNQLPLFDNYRNKEIRSFIDSITTGFATSEDIVPSRIIEERVDKLSPAIALLQSISNSRIKGERGNFFRDAIKYEPDVFEVIRIILGIQTTVYLENGLEISSTTPKNERSIKLFEKLLEDVKFWDLICSSQNVESLVRVALIAENSERRPFSIFQNVKNRFFDLLRTSVELAMDNLGIRLNIASARDFLRANLVTLQTSISERGIDYVIKDDERNIAAIKFVYLSNIGGSQLRDLRDLYPDVQKQLNTIPLRLILVADGSGFLKVGEQVLDQLFNSVSSVLTIKQVEQGELFNAIIEAATVRDTRSIPEDKIIESILLTGKNVHAQDLPMNEDKARLSLAAYSTSTPNLALSLSPGGESLSWVRSHEVQNAILLKEKFQFKLALDIFCKLINGHSNIIDKDDEELDYAIVSTFPNQVIPSEFIVASSDKYQDIEIHKLIARRSLKIAPKAKIAVLLIPDDQNIEISESDRYVLQASLSTNVVVLDSQTLLDLAQGKKYPKDEFSSLILEQSDLSKISPYVLNSATPRRMYFGREKEEATLLSTLSSNSVALLGSRRIGKTSLMLNAKESLEKANFLAMYLDCQTVKSWADFGHRAAKEWDIILPVNFLPKDLFDLVNALKSNDEMNLVILLDEIDRLLTWDMESHEDQVPEAFFRTCRTISQSGKAQFVFSGERTISFKLWDPQSPHWNFSRPLQLQQLNRESTAKLLIEPLQSLQVEILDKSEFINLVWKITNGHPQITQFLGDSLVQLLNTRPSKERTVLSVNDLNYVTDSFEFKDHYISTYWGQANSLEKLISLLVVQGISSPSEIINAFSDNHRIVSETEVSKALRILVLYGIIQQTNGQYRLRAQWFPTALDAYGDLEQTINRYWSMQK